MKEIINKIPLYRFLKYCNDTNLEKTVLDCGAGGNCPPLSIFKDFGYKTSGIELDEKQIERAESYEKSHGLTLNIKKGNMQSLNFPDETFNFVYSYNSVFHMKKADVEKSVCEMKRVLKKNGLLFVNFLTVNDFRVGTGEDLGNNQFIQMDEEPVIHSYYEKNEPDKYLSDMEILFKEDRVQERIYEGGKIRQGFVDYIARKK